MPTRTTAPAMPIAGVVDAEVVGGEVDGLGEQRVDERRAHRCRGEQTEHQQLGRRRAGPVAPTSLIDDRLPGEDPADRRAGTASANHGIDTS